MGSLVFLPSAGYWYAGEADWIGMGFRGLALGGLVGGLLAAEHYSHEDKVLHSAASIGVVLGAGGCFLVGVAMGPLTSQRAVERHNQRVLIAPLVSPHSAGLSLVGTF